MKTIVLLLLLSITSKATSDRRDGERGIFKKIFGWMSSNGEWGNFKKKFNINPDGEWENFKKRFGIQYSPDDANDETDKKNNFLENLRIVKERNDRWKRGVLLYESSIYDFSDLSETDFIAQKTGLILPR